jgi:ABC-2 type transport system permease protein
VIALFSVQVIQAIVICAVAFALGWSPEGGSIGLPVAALGALLGTFAFASLGLFMAGTLRAEATLAAANLIYLLLMMGGGVVLPRSSYGAAGDVLRFLPSGALGDALRAGLTEGRCDSVAMLTLVAWAILGSALAARYFKWE